MRILAIDPSSSAPGFALFQDEVAMWCETYKPKGDTLVDRMGEVLKHEIDLILGYNPDYIGVETPYLGLNRATAMKMGQIFGFICAGIIMAGRTNNDIVQIHPLTAKKAAGLQKIEKREDGKTFVMEAMHHRFPHLVIVDDNSSDALAIGLATIEKVKEKEYGATESD